MTKILRRATNALDKSIRLTVCPVIYGLNRKNEMGVKNNARARLFIDRVLLDKRGIRERHFELVEFNEKGFYVVIKPSSSGFKAIPTYKGSPYFLVTLSLSKLVALKNDQFPKINREPCTYHFFEDGCILILLPLKVS